MSSLLKRSLALLATATAQDLLIDFDPTLFTLAGVDVSDDLAVAMLTGTHLNISALTVSHGSGPAWATCRSAQRLVETLPELHDIPLECGGGYTKSTPNFRDASMATHPAVELIRDKTLQSGSYLEGGGVTWLALGPGTHFAAALHHHPSLSRYIQEIVMVGSRLDGGFELTSAADVGAFSFLLNATSVPRFVVPMESVDKFAMNKQAIERMSDESSCGSWMAPLKGKLKRHALGTYFASWFTPNPFGWLTSRPSGFKPLSLLASLVVAYPVLGQSICRTPVRSGKRVRYEEQGTAALRCYRGDAGRSVRLLDPASVRVQPALGLAEKLLCNVGVDREVEPSPLPREPSSIGLGSTIPEMQGWSSTKDEILEDALLAAAFGTPTNSDSDL